LSHRISRERRIDLLLLGGFLAFAAALAALGASYYRGYAENYRAEVAARLAAVADLKAGDIERYRRERVGDASLFHGNRDFGGLAERLAAHPNSPDLRRRTRVWLDRIRESCDYDRVSLFLPGGRELLGSPPPRSESDPDLAPGIAQVLRTGEVAFVDLYRDRDDGRIYLTLLAPILSPSGGPARIVLALRIDPHHYLFPFVGRWHLPARTAETTLVRREGDRAVLLDELRDGTAAPPSASLPLSRGEIPAVKAIRGTVGHVEGADSRGVPVVACIRPIKDSPWFLVTGMERAEMEAPLRERLGELLFFLSALLVTAGLGLAWIRRGEKLRFYRERCRATEAVREREEFLDAVLDRIADPMCVKDSEHRWVRVNEKFCELLGIPRERLLGRSDPDFLPPEQTEVFWRADREVLETGVENLNGEYLTNASTGETRYIHTKKTLYVDGKGHRFVVAVARDQTEERRIREELLVNRDRLETSQIIGKVGSWEYDLLAEKLWGSREGLRIFGIDPDSTDRGCLEIERIESRIPERDRVHQALLDLIERGLPYDLEYRVLPPPGEAPRTVTSLARVVRDGTGGALRVAGVVQDVTERRRMEQALRESEEKLRRAEAVGHLGHTEVDLETGRCSWSDELYRIFGIAPEEEPLCASEERLRRLVHPEDRESLKRQTSAVMAGESGNLEYRILRPDGETRHVTAVVEVRRNGTGQPAGLFATVQDTTDLRRKERELGEKNAELERFTYTISHDLRSPLVTVKTFLGYLEADLARSDPEQVEKDLFFVRSATDKMGRLLDELLQMSRVGQTASPPSRIPFRELAEETLRAVAGSIAARGVEVRVAEDPTILLGERSRLAAIWQNLVENAVKYMGDQPHPLIELGVEGTGRETIFTVRDNGMGIDPRYREKIFGLFEKLDSRSEGTGFGLALAKRIVEFYGGTIRVKSEGIGRGSLFLFTLPEAVRAGRPDGETKRAAEGE
jgi:PAS domain S-box-containing protein